MLCHLLVKSTLDKHKRYIHAEEKNYKCNICNGSFAKISFRDSHVMTVHGETLPDREEHLRCDICDKIFSRIGDKNTHIKFVHKGKRPYKCITCDKEYFNKQHLMDHIAFIHEGQRNYECKICNKSYGYKAKYYRHIKSVGHIKTVDLRTTSKNSLQNHFQTILIIIYYFLHF